MKKIIIPILLIGAVAMGLQVYFSNSPAPLVTSEHEVIFQEKQEDAIKNEYSLDEKEIRKIIGQMLIVGFRGTSVDKNSYITKAVKDLNLGGVILFDYDVPSATKGRNVINPAQTKKLISDISSYSETPLFISIDAEGGMVNRLKPAYGFIDIPSHEALGKGTMEKTKETAETLGKELSELGINFDFAPVVDLNTNPQNPVIGKLERSFGNNSALVTKHASAFINGLHAYNILTSIKHFPGHGSSDADSHLGIVDVTDTYNNEELKPFQTLIEDGFVDTVMVAHVFNRNIDPNYPASLSGMFINDLLRGTLGFDGVIISDDMDMGAIRKNYGFDDAVVRAIKAGTDMLIISNNGSVYNESSPKQAIDAIWEAIKTEEIPLSDIYASAERIRTLKQKIQ